MFHLPSTKSSYIHIEGFERPAVEPPVLPESVLVRRAAASDDARIRVLARLDDRRMPGGPFLVAELGDEIVAAMSLKTRAVVADPFRRTADASDLLRLRGEQIAARELADAKLRPQAALKPAAA
jgi:hypothetical protein